MKKLIALTGPKGVGKSTFARRIQAETTVLPRDIQIVSFAGPLKRMLFAILPAEAFFPEGKEDPKFGLCGKTPRFLMQTLGTEWGRQIIGEDVWVEAVKSQILASSAQTILIDDLRFPNEAEMVKEMGGEVWVVKRPFHTKTDHGSEHASEKGIPTQLIDGVVTVGGEHDTWLAEHFCGGVERFISPCV
jgi:hypothetical protein